MRRADAVVDRRDHVLRLLERDQAHGRALVGRLAQAGVAARELHLARERREAVAEAAVDHLLGGPERRDRLTALADVLELGAHHRREDAAAAVRRQHADDGDAAAADGPPGTVSWNGNAPAPPTIRSPSKARVHPLERQVAAKRSARLVVAGQPPK